MINISYEKNPDLYLDYENCINFLKNIENQKLKDKVNFHIYSEINNEKELLCIESFFATQNLETSKLILWSDYDISNKECLIPFKNFIDFRIYDVVHLSKDTPIENNLNVLNARDRLYYLNSDLLRLLACYKLGGCWVDMDIVFLRDMSPVLDQEFLYMWGSEVDFSSQGACATVMNLFKNSSLGLRFIEKINENQIIPNSTIWGKELFAKTYSHEPYCILPSTFFNTEWCINKKYKGLGTEIENQWFTSELKNKDYLFLEAFTWHWHNSSHKNDKIVENSKFNILQKIIKNKLKNTFYN